MPEGDGHDAELIDQLRRGDERAFSTLIERHNIALLRLAQVHVRDRAIAEEVVQDTWLGVLQGIDRFEGRSSLATWIYRILVNRAKSRGERERRQVPLSALSLDDAPEVDPERFRPEDDPERPMWWAAPPRAWPHERLLARETVERLRTAIEELPGAQQVVIGLRDVEGFSAQEVCELLMITPGNQRVLLHRARSKLRAALEDYFGYQ